MPEKKKSTSNTINFGLYSNYKPDSAGILQISKSKNCVSQFNYTELPQAAYKLCHHITDSLNEIQNVIHKLVQSNPDINILYQKCFNDEGSFADVWRNNFSWIEQKAQFLIGKQNDEKAKPALARFYNELDNAFTKPVDKPFYDGEQTHEAKLRTFAEFKKTILKIEKLHPELKDELATELKLISTSYKNLQNLISRKIEFDKLQNQIV